MTSTEFLLLVIFFIEVIGFGAIAIALGDITKRLQDLQQ